MDITETVLLRKMTLKSRMPFGVFAGQEIGVLLSCNVNYLRWTYYHCERITFIDSVLDQMGIIEEYRIDKPGKSTEMFSSFKNYKAMQRTDLDRVKRYSQKKKRRKLKCARLEIATMMGKSHMKNKHRKLST